MVKDAIDFLKKCIEIYSPSGQEEEYSNFIADFLENKGFKVSFDKIGNLIAEKGEGKPELLLVSHLDTIPGELPVIEKEGKIYGRGAVDCKPSLAAMVYSISQINFEQQDIGKLVFAGIVREEDSLEGIQEFMKSGVNPDFSIFGEATKINQICIGYKGRLCIGFRVLSQSGHVASSWQYINSIEVALEIWNIIKGICWQLTEQHCPTNEPKKYFNKIIPNLSLISGGQYTNCVPATCEMHIDIRFPPEISSQLLLSEIRSKVMDFKKVYESNVKGEFQIQENISSLIEGFEVSGNELIVGALRWAIFNTIKEKPILIKKTGTTFINQIGIEFNIPSITYGPGDPRLEHTTEEFIEIEEYKKSIEIFTKFISKLYENYKKSNLS
jgi:LysW-gamma-L-lysine carboxypeptidase